VKWTRPSFSCFVSKPHKFSRLASFQGTFTSIPECQTALSLTRISHGRTTENSHLQARPRRRRWYGKGIPSLERVADDKTTFVKRHLTGEFEKKYIATLGVEGVSPFSARGQRLIRQYIRSRFIPTLDKSALTRGTQPDRRSSAGCETGTISKVVPAAAIDLTVLGQCGIIMFDVTSRITYKNVPNWHRTSLSPPIQSPRPRANTSNMPR
jgi:hypothetical protein